MFELAKQEFLSKAGLAVYHEEVKGYVEASVEDANTFATEADVAVLSEAQTYTDEQLGNYMRWGTF